MVEKGLSERRALIVARMSASALRYEPEPDHHIELREQIAALAHRHQHYGVGMIHLKLRQKGLVVNYKSVEGLYQEAGLQVCRRKPKKVAVGERQPLLRPSATNYDTLSTKVPDDCFLSPTSLNLRHSGASLLPNLNTARIPHVTVQSLFGTISLVKQAHGQHLVNLGLEALQKLKKPGVHWFRRGL